MLDLLQRLVNLDWWFGGASLQRVPLLGSRLWYADFPARRPLRPAERDPLRRASQRAGEGPRARPAPTLVLLHGLGASSISFYPVVQQLRRTYRVIIPDLPGCGLSLPPPGRDFLRFPELVDVVE